jgi:hypothetical protein
MASRHYFKVPDILKWARLQTMVLYRWRQNMDNKQVRGSKTPNGTESGKK